VAEAIVSVADVSFAVVRACYVALQCASAHPLTSRASGLVVFEEERSAIHGRLASEVLGRPLLATVVRRAEVARAVDAGTLAARLPDSLQRPVLRLLRSAGVVPERVASRALFRRRAA
jgi:hypothetical protein